MIATDGRHPCVIAREQYGEYAELMHRAITQVQSCQRLYGRQHYHTKSALAVLRYVAGQKMDAWRRSIPTV